jgi:hypothetical protein
VPARLIEGGIATERLLAGIAVSECADELPLYRQEAIFAREKVELGRNLMACWMGHVGFADRLFQIVRGGDRSFAVNSIGWADRRRSPAVGGICAGSSTVSLRRNRLALSALRLDSLRMNGPVIVSTSRRPARHFSAEFHVHWESELTRISGKSKLAEAIRYGLSRKAEFRRFLEDVASNSTTTASNARSDRRWLPQKTRYWGIRSRRRDLGDDRLCACDCAPQ